MCFSASASFTSSAVLTVLGLATLERNTNPRMLSAIPILFAAQQAIEGCIWLAMADSMRTTQASIAVASYLGFAWVLWPVWIPLALLQLESRARARRTLARLAWVGVAVAAYGVFVLCMWRPIARVAHHSIRYDFPRDGERWVQVTWLGAYVVATIVPFWSAPSLRIAKSLGLLLLAGLLTTLLVEMNALTSVWCFFATSVSVCIAADAFRRPRLLAIAS